MQKKTDRLLTLLVFTLLVIRHWLVEKNKKKTKMTKTRWAPVEMTFISIANRNERSYEILVVNIYAYRKPYRVARSTSCSFSPAVFTVHNICIYSFLFFFFLRNKYEFPKTDEDFEFAARVTTTAGPTSAAAARQEAARARYKIKVVTTTRRRASRLPTENKKRAKELLTYTTI